MHDKYMYAAELTIEKHEEGCLIMPSNSTQVVCMGRHESEIADMILEAGLSYTIQHYKKLFSGETIETDIVDFCNELVERAILIPINNE